MTNREKETKRTSDDDSKEKNHPGQSFSEKVSKDIENRFKSREKNANETDQRRPHSGKGV